jgi:CMP-N-acetylneuraminic acid synthetase
MLIDRDFPDTVIIQTARAGSKSVPLKNELVINEKPLYLHNILAAGEVVGLPSVFCYTNIKSAVKLAETYGFRVLNRPEELSGDLSSHYDCMRDALLKAEAETQIRYEFLVVILGNNRCCFPQDLELGLETLEQNSELDSVISISKYNMFNPLRAFNIKPDGMLKAAISIPSDNMMSHLVANDKDIMGDIYFFNGSFWIMRRESFDRNEGPPPFPWLGKNIGFVSQDPRCMEVDADWQVPIVERYGV